MTPCRHCRARPPRPEWPNRLPAGAAKQLRWDGELWQGRLAVPGVAGAFACSAPTEREACHGLHKMYVEYLQSETEQAPGVTPCGGETTTPADLAGPRGSRVES